MKFKFKNCFLKRKNSIQQGLKKLKTLNQISIEINSRQLEEQHIKSLMHLKKIYKQLKDNMDEHCDSIQSMNLQRFASNSEMSQKNQINQEQSQEQQLQDVNVEDVMDQKELVMERDQNILEITKALNEIKDMSQAMFEVTQTGGQKLDKVLIQQDKHLEDIEKKLQVDLDVTEDYQGRMLKRCCFYSVIIVGILGCILLLLYMLKKQDSPSEAKKLLLI